MPTTAGSLDLISMIIDRWISLWTNIASSTFRVTTNNWVSSASGSRLVTRQMPDASTSRICLLFWKKLTMIPFVCILCLYFEKVDDGILYNFSDISFQLISTKRSLARYSSKTKDEKLTNTSIKTQNYTFLVVISVVK